MTQKNIIIAISGASGAIYGIRCLEILNKIANIKTHLIISESAAITIKQETEYKLKEIISLADFHYNNNNIAACIASGSFKTHGMIIAPCSIKTMSAITHSLSHNLITRAADVCLKEQRKLVLMVRESPFHAGHLENMSKLAKVGAIIAPPVTAFYNHPNNIQDLVDHHVLRCLDLFDVEHRMGKAWLGLTAKR